mmetsp:Transcript_20958/g.65138  ORF Transcript_20958/g.65138 Transcript_20958/m.65138 type:complete len:224 (+) Transcript_20958:702-1373(+)
MLTADVSRPPRSMFSSMSRTSLRSYVPSSRFAAGSSRRRRSSSSSPDCVETDRSRFPASRSSIRPYTKSSIVLIAAAISRSGPTLSAFITFQTPGYFKTRATTCVWHVSKATMNGCGLPSRPPRSAPKAISLNASSVSTKNQWCMSIMARFPAGAAAISAAMTPASFAAARLNTSDMKPRKRLAENSREASLRCSNHGWASALKMPPPRKSWRASPRSPRLTA